MRSHQLVFAIALTALLSACGTQSDTPLSRFSLGLWENVSRPSGNADQPSGPVIVQESAPVLTRAALQELGEPLILVVLESTQQAAILRQTQTHNGYTSWITVDGASIVMRNGLLTATRGLGADLMSADVSDTENLLRHLREGQADRLYVTLDAQFQERTERFTCQISAHGTERIDILGTEFTARHMRETCTGSDKRFVNAYWMDARGQFLRTRQWVGQSVAQNLAYIQIDKLSE